ncbi:MAG: 3'-5' exonuclease [Motiliproteus sp.]
MANRLEPPSKADILQFRPFSGLPIQRIVVPTTPEQLAEASADLLRCRFVGFDTESKPCFKPGEISDGPHVVQLTTPERGYVFQLYRPGTLAVVKQLLESTTLIKVGFGLRSDRRYLQRKLAITLAAVLDLDVLFRAEGYRRELGVKAAVAVVLRQRFHKSKRISTSNWARAELRTNQLLYAANDAYAALKLLLAMDVDLGNLPIEVMEPSVERS